ncbi:MAG: MFS transporter [Dehalococcoidia bacterium]
MAIAGPSFLRTRNSPLGTRTIGGESAGPHRTLEDNALTNSRPDAQPLRHDPLAALRLRNFLFFTGSRLFSGAGSTMLAAAIAWQVYQISGSALSLGVLGLIRFIPALGISLPAGAVADSYDRRRIVIVAQFAPMLASAVLLLTTSRGSVHLPLTYALVLLIALAAAFENPARQALLPLLVPREIFANAVIVNSAMQQLAFVAGPSIGGLLIGIRGVAAAYALNVVLMLAAILSLLFLRPRRESGGKRAVTIAAIREGVRFVRRQQVLLGAMILDMFGVIFAGATALLPIYAETILHVGAGGYGLLSSSLAIGALLMSLVLVFLPPVKQTGRVLLIGVASYGLATMAFGISRTFPLSLLAYGLTGAADQVSVVMRQTTIQLATPDALRGRVSSVSSLFIGAANQVGSVESGLVAALTNATFSVVSGGAGCIAVVAAIATWMPELRRYRIPRLRPED